jgi:lysophospholipase L1-like esterase
MTGTIVEEAPEVWEEEVRVLEAGDPRHPLPRAGIVFIGSSSIRMWTTLARDMAPLRVVNRGFGGAQVDAVLHYTPRLVLPLRPRAVVLGAGENDLEAIRGKSPERVLDDVSRFDDLVRGALPGVRSYFLNVKPSPARRAVWPRACRYNELLRTFVEAVPSRGLLDVATPTFDADGNRRVELFLEDGLHLSAAGYAMWTSVVRPRLMADLGGGGAEQ